MQPGCIDTQDPGPITPLRYITELIGGQVVHNYAVECIEFERLGNAEPSTSRVKGSEAPSASEDALIA